MPPRPRRPTRAALLALMVATAPVVVGCGETQPPATVDVTTPINTAPRRTSTGNHADRKALRPPGSPKK